MRVPSAGVKYSRPCPALHWRCTREKLKAYRVKSRGLDSAASAVSGGNPGSSLLSAKWWWYIITQTYDRDYNYIVTAKEPE